ncbi:MAG TPA: hypothetical protein VHU80_10110 [Polyangiaceae bacterium]|nr:hypothetical protein [Polyangiaceae bacterium]
MNVVVTAHAAASMPCTSPLPKADTTAASEPVVTPVEPVVTPASK